MSGCLGCNPNQQLDEVINKAKQDAKKTQEQYVIYFTGEQWQYCLRSDAIGIPYTMVVSQFTP